MGKTTEDTAMELDAEGAASFEQLQDLIKKECDKRDKKYRSLEQKYNNLQDLVENTTNQKNLQSRGQRGASRRPLQTQRGRPATTKRQQNGARQNSATGRKEKADDTNNDATNANPVKSKRNRRSRSQPKKKPTAIDRSKSRTQSKTN